MIPIQVKLDGFMSYRDEAVLRFAGAELWMLCGRNGAGKSTIFDAMKFALFGTHRDGSQGAEVLVHHEKDALQVEFDFQVNDDIFRVRRTLKRGARPTFQAFHVAGPNPPRLNAPAPQAVPETDSRDGLRRWIESHIGLSEQTFSAAVLLQQGKSDALLTAKNEDRHALLTEIIDLSAYENLHERTDEKRKEFESAAKSLRTQLEHKPAVDTSQIARLAEQVASLSGTLDETRCALEEILSLQV
ncbi:MAG: SMC family ATPase, partial [Abitibacteriaceae bacterium]|nr:SMC family ATPase [Abditibacteriaceae bacterium]